MKKQAGSAYNIPRPLKGCHPAILQAKKYLGEGLQIDDYAISYYHDEPVLVVRATKLASRALRLPEALIRALERRGIALVRHHKPKSRWVRRSMLTLWMVTPGFSTGTGAFRLQNSLPFCQ
jgi:hypothetical protein